MLLLGRCARRQHEPLTELAVDATVDTLTLAHVRANHIAATCAVFTRHALTVVRICIKQCLIIIQTSFIKYNMMYVLVLLRCIGEATLNVKHATRL